VLAVVAWNMIERPAIAVLLRSGWGEAAVLAITFFLTIFRDLTEAIVAGFALGSLLFIHRMSESTAVKTETPFVGVDMADIVEPRGAYDEAQAANPEVVIYRITGVFFFGAAASIGSLLDRISDTHKTLIIDFSAVPFLDSTGANVIEGLAHKTHRRGVQLWITGASPSINQVLITHGLREPHCNYAATAQAAMQASIPKNIEVA
jgi:SulP family sulfate permease